MKNIILILALSFVGCASMPESGSRDWVTMFNEARTWRDSEVAFQEMQRNDYIRFVEQGLRIVGITQAAGSNPPTGAEREAVIFWTTSRALDEWQDNLNDAEAKNRSLVGMRRLMELERLGYKVGEHVHWLVARVQELDGVRIDARKFPVGKKRWHFGAGSFGSYLLYVGGKTNEYEKSGGLIGRTLASVCVITLLCQPYGDDRWVLDAVKKHVAVTIFNSNGDPIKIKGLHLMPGSQEPKSAE